MKTLLIIILNLFLFLQIGLGQTEKTPPSPVETSDEHKMNSEPSDCEKVKSGKFKIPIEGTDMISFIERRDSLQIESLDGEMVCKFKITWLTTCKYEMSAVTCKDESMSEMFEGMTLINNIYEVTETGYKFISQIKGDDTLIKGEAFTLKKSNSKM